MGLGNHTEITNGNAPQYDDIYNLRGNEEGSLKRTLHNV